MIDAQPRYQDQADKQRTTAPRFRPGDLVWFLSKNTCSVRPSRKLDHKLEGHFKIMEDPKLKTPMPPGWTSLPTSKYTPCGTSPN